MADYLHQRPRTAPAATVRLSRRDTEAQAAVNSTPNITVAVRVRPETVREKTGKYQNVVRILDEHVVIFDENENDRYGMPAHARKARNKQYAFDRVFGEDSKQQEVFENTTLPLIDSILHGYNATVFAYGSTGAGKTYTMMGTAEAPGVMVLTMQELFRRVGSMRDKHFKVGLQYLEVYNETIHDLLQPSGALHLREDPLRGPIVSGLSEHFPSSASEVLELLRRGNLNRSQSPTDANAESSRSHAVLQIMVHQTDRTAHIEKDVKVGKLSLIDLAGSERAKVTKNRGERLVEGANINRSLLALGNCINALCENKPGAHIPYRDSKLTRLLKDSLGGNCRTVMIANASPSSMYYEDTHNTLKYANRAKNIKTQVNANINNVRRHVSEYVTIIEELRQEISELKSQLENGGDGGEGSSGLLSSKNEDGLRAAERANIEKAKQELLSAFERKKEIRLNLLKLEEDEAELARESEAIRNSIVQTKAEEGPAFGTPVRLREKIQRIDFVVDEAKQRKTDLHRQFSLADERVETILNTVPHTVSSPSKREMVELLSDVQSLELANIELRAKLSSAEALIAHQRSKITHLEASLFRVQEGLASIAAAPPSLDQPYSGGRVDGPPGSRTYESDEEDGPVCIMPVGYGGDEDDDGVTPRGGPNTNGPSSTLSSAPPSSRPHTSPQPSRLKRLLGGNTHGGVGGGGEGTWATRLGDSKTHLRSSGGSSSGDSGPLKGTQNASVVSLENISLVSISSPHESNQHLTVTSPIESSPPARPRSSATNIPATASTTANTNTNTNATTTTTTNNNNNAYNHNNHHNAGNGVRPSGTFSVRTSIVDKFPVQTISPAKVRRGRRVLPALPSDAETHSGRKFVSSSTPHFHLDLGSLNLVSSSLPSHPGSVVVAGSSGSSTSAASTPHHPSSHLAYPLQSSSQPTSHHFHYGGPPSGGQQTTGAGTAAAAAAAAAASLTVLPTNSQVSSQPLSSRDRLDANVAAATAASNARKTERARRGGGGESVAVPSRLLPGSIIPLKDDLSVAPKASAHANLASGGALGGGGVGLGGGVGGSAAALKVGGGKGAVSGGQGPIPPGSVKAPARYIIKKKKTSPPRAFEQEKENTTNGSPVPAAESKAFKKRALGAQAAQPQPFSSRREAHGISF